MFLKHILTSHNALKLLLRDFQRDFGNCWKVEFRSFEMMSLGYLFRKEFSNSENGDSCGFLLRVAFWRQILDLFLDMLDFGGWLEPLYGISFSLLLIWDLFAHQISLDLFGHVVSFSVYLDTDLDSNLDLKVSVDYNQREFLSEELMAGVVLVWFKLNINYNEIFID
ncbi:hypothetical protein RhiirB3_445898 [Rhizophagus irregularis]|nr:hypothetical protein RhiirB3_445898 [Rhizophagus irregularis]